MRFGRFVIFLLLIGAALAGLSGAVKRPHDPWVFRCVLDKKPRMVVIALHESLWVAYDATTCSLYKAWRGDVNFDGAVYTTEHGPQPTIRGEVMLDGADSGNWTLDNGDGARECTSTWKGYRTQNDRVTLLYELKSPDGRIFHLEEQVDVNEIPDSADQIQLVRTFATRDVPTNAALAVTVPAKQKSGQDLKIAVDGKEAPAPNAGAATKTIPIKSNGRTALTTTLKSSAKPPANTESETAGGR